MLGTLGNACGIIVGKTERRAVTLEALRFVGYNIKAEYKKISSKCRLYSSDFG